MDKQVNKKLRKLWIHVLVIIFAIPCFFMGRAFAYWAGLVNPPADQDKTANNPIGSGKNLDIEFTFEEIYDSSDNLVPIGCAQYAYPGDTVVEFATKDFKVSWNTTDTTASETNIIIEFIKIGLCDDFLDPLDPDSFYNDYSSNCKVSVSKGTYGPSGDPSSFSGTTVGDGDYFGNTLGEIEFMLDRTVETILRFQVSITDYSRMDDATYRRFKNAVANSNFRIELRYTVENPNLYKSGDIWLQFNLAPVTNQDLEPYLYLTNDYIYQSNVKIYYEGQSYSAGDILYVNDPNSPHYGKYYMVFITGSPININNPNTSGGAYMTWAEATDEYREYHFYYQGDFVVESDGIYFWNRYLSHKPNVSNVAPPNGSWRRYTTDTTLNVWQRHKAYTYGDVVRWWTTSSVGTNRPITRYYVSIMDINIISSNNPWTNGMGTYPGSSGYTDQWLTDTDFKARSDEFDSTRQYNEGESMYILDGTNKVYYIATRDAVPGRTPENSPDHWKFVNIP